MPIVFVCFYADSCTAFTSLVKTEENYSKTETWHLNVKLQIGTYFHSDV